MYSLEISSVIGVDFHIPEQSDGYICAVERDNERSYAFLFTVARNFSFVTVVFGIKKPLKSVTK
jgi:hypothetical protein